MGTDAAPDAGATVEGSPPVGSASSGPVPVLPEAVQGTEGAGDVRSTQKGSRLQGESVDELLSSRVKHARPRWTEQDDYLAVKAVVGAGAHVAPYGEATKRFAAAVDSFNKHPQATRRTEGKKLRDRFYLLKNRFAFEDKSEALKTGNKKDLTRLDHLLIDVVERMDEHERSEAEARGQCTKKNKILQAKGEAIRQMAVQRWRDRRPLADAPVTSRAGEERDESLEDAGPAGGAVEPRGVARRRPRDVPDYEDVDVVGAIERCEKRRCEMVERQLEQAQKHHEEEMARRTREDEKRREREDARDAALKKVLDAISRRLN